MATTEDLWKEIEFLRKQRNALREAYEDLQRQRQVMERSWKLQRMRLALPR